MESGRGRDLFSQTDPGYKAGSGSPLCRRGGVGGGYPGRGRRAADQGRLMAAAVFAPHRLCRLFNALFWMAAGCVNLVAYGQVGFPPRLLFVADRAVSH